MKRLNHSRYIDNGAKDIGNDAYHRAKATPTAKQIKFYNKLYAMCKENGIDTKTGEYTRTRQEYAMAIDKLIERLKEHGIDMNGNGKHADYVIKIGEDERGRAYARERIRVHEAWKELTEHDICGGRE